MPAPTSAGSPLARVVKRHTREADDDDDAGARPKRQHSLADAVPESVCPLCFQIMPPAAPLRSSPAAALDADADVDGNDSPSPASSRSSRAKTPRQRQRGGARHKRLFPLLPPPAGSLTADRRPDDTGPFDPLDRTTANVDDSRSNTGAMGAVILGDDKLAGTTYFELLSEANSLANTPTSTGGRRRGGGSGSGSARITAAAAAAESPERRGHSKDEGLDSHQMNEGYYARFFDEVSLLGTFTQSHLLPPRLRKQMIDMTLE